MSKTKNSYGTATELSVNGQPYHYHSLPALAAQKIGHIAKLPYSIRVLLENLLRYEDGVTITRDDIAALANWDAKATPEREIFFMPSRVILQDFTGVPAVADLAAMRAAIKRLGGNPEKINPYTPADLVIDHSVQVDHYGSSSAFAYNGQREFERNGERYQFLRWGQKAFRNFSVVPPNSGIVHQVNLEYLAHVAMSAEVDGVRWAYPDSVLGTDSHTTMINGLGVLGWGVGGIEAEAALLGQPSSMLIPQVVGFKLVGEPSPGCTATDIVLTITQILRKKGVVGKFVEYYGPGLEHLSLADRATIANMAPEYGATVGFFPVDERTIDYLRLTGREAKIPLVEAYYKAQGLWYDSASPQPVYSDEVVFDLSGVEPCLAGPSRPQDRVSLGDVRASFRRALVSRFHSEATGAEKDGMTQWIAEGGNPVMLAPELATAHPDEKMDTLGTCVPVRQPDGVAYSLCHGSVVIAAITSCTNTSNPSVLMAAGLLAKKAVQRGLHAKPWVKTSLAPGSKVVTDYLQEAGVLSYLEALHFHLVGYGCTTCIGNSGNLPYHISKAVQVGDLSVASVLSGNRNFEGRVNPLVRANYLASPPLVVAYAIAGNVNIDLSRDPLGVDPNGEYVYLRDIWPSRAEIDALVRKFVVSTQYKRSYANVFQGTKEWTDIKVPEGELFQWDVQSTYIKEPPFFSDMTATPVPLSDIRGARVLALLGDSVTTDHISPAGAIQKDGPAARYLNEQGVTAKDFNSYGSRRGNHEVMVRGTFANIRLKNKLAPGTEGGVTRFLPTNEKTSIYDAAMRYTQQGIPTIIIAGKEYGTGSSRDWAAKGPRLLGIKAVIAESFERIHRSNLVGMGLLPLQFLPNETAASLGLTGEETFELIGIAALQQGQKLDVKAADSSGKTKTFTVMCRIDTPNELEYFRHGGILPYVLRQTLRG